MRSKVVVGNWKLNGSLAGNESLLKALLREVPRDNPIACAVCVPSPYLAQVRALLEGTGHGMHPTCLRFATIYGVAPRMRFDLTINQFTLDLWADRTLEVYGERFWRPYVHVRDAARAVRLVVEAAPELVDRQVFNVGRSDENYTKLDIVEQIRRHISTGAVRYVPRDEDPRDYKVSFDRIRDVLGFGLQATVPDGIVETASALSRGEFDDPFASLYRNVP